MDAEAIRLEQARTGEAAWKKWGPYLAERQWGTVREDYSDSGDAWSYFSHDHARSRVYRWGEDGLGGICDDQQLLCFAIALWNGHDPILKERLFGLTNGEGNHGEDVKEYYFYLDSTPTHSYMKYLYKYPHAAFPYTDLIRTNRRRSRTDYEYELLDTGVFDDNQYFDVFVEYAKASPDDVLVEITICNRGTAAAALHLLPTIWLRRTWSWHADEPRPLLRAGRGSCAVSTFHPQLGERHLYAEGATEVLFTDNETNTALLFGTPNRTPFTKDGINDYIVNGERGRVNPEKTGTKAAAHYSLTIEGRSSQVIRLRLCGTSPAAATPSQAGHQPFGAEFNTVMTERQREADEFYASIIPPSLDPDTANVMRQALAGMLWSKQFYYYDLDRWLGEHGADPFKPMRTPPRNEQWHHMYNANILSMPDKWEYPWFAAWDLAFHVLALTLVDPDFGKQQLDVILGERYLHPNGQLPAYEWNFGDVNPPVHAWSTMFTYRLEVAQRGEGDLEWLERSFHKLLLNFTWWANRKDRNGNNAFEGGFLGLDNIGVFDCSAPLPTGGFLEQADGTAWMALFCQNMVEIAVELTLHRPVYQEMCLKFVEHFMWIATALMHAGRDTGMWDEEDGFFSDVHLQRFLDAHPELTSFIHDPSKAGHAGRRLGAVLNESKLRRVLARMLDEQEFLSPFGIRSLSRYHVDHPYAFRLGNERDQVRYLPAESDSAMFGGNSNWRGPIWMPINGLIIRALIQYYAYYGNDFLIECPTGSGRHMNLYQVAEEIGHRLSRIFLRDEQGRRPVYGGTAMFQEDPYWRDLLLFYEYFHGDNGAGLGASHQTGWTGCIARIIHFFETTTPERVLQLGKTGILSAARQPLTPV